MTKAGIGFIIGGVVVYILGSQTQVGWLYLFDAMIWSVVALSFLLTRWSLGPLRIERQALVSRSPDPRLDPATPTEGGTVEIRLKVRNRGRLARHFIKVVEYCPLDEPSGGPRVFLLPSVKSRSELAFSYTAVCYRRGRYASAEAVLEAADPLGLFVRRRRYDIPLSVTVYPAYYDMEAMPAAREVWSDQGQTVRSNAASDFYGSREYRYGDPLRHIHWRNTARLGEFVVRQFEETMQGSLAVAFELGRDWGVGKETTVEYSIRIAASLARHCGASGRSIGILAPPTPTLRAHWFEAMEYLAGLTVGGNAGLDELTDSVEAGQTLAAIVPAARADLIPGLSRLAARHVRLVVVLLEGFSEGETPRDFASHTGESGLELVRCSRGNLKAAIDTLGNSLRYADRLPSAVG